MNDISLQLFFVMALIALNGYFAAAEIALVSVRRSTLKSRAGEGSVAAKRALALVDDPSRLLATVQVGVTLVGFMASAIAAVSIAGPLAEWMRALGIPALSRISDAVAVGAVTLVIAYVTLVFGELAPKRLGLRRAETVALRVARPISALASVLGPVVWFLARSTDVAARVLGVKGRGGQAGVTEEEIKLLVTEQGTLLDEEKRMIHEIFELGDTVAREVMVPRVDTVFIGDTATLMDALEVARRKGFSRMPVIHEDPDNVIGIVLLKDLVGPAAEGRTKESVVSFMRRPVFVPETKPILSLLSEMQRMRNHMAIVVDEHGGTAGIITIEDIVEEIIGEVVDEFDPDLRYVTELYPGTWVIDGRFGIEDAMEMGLPVAEGEYETLAGWLLAQLGHIPVQGEEVVVDGVTFRIQAVRRRRIARIVVTGDVGAGASRGGG